MNQVINWSYPDWDERIEMHAYANFDKSGFSRGYLVKQIRHYVKPYLSPKKTLDEGKLEKTILEAIDEFVDKNGGIMQRGISIRLSNKLRNNFYSEDDLDDIKIESIIKKQIDEVGKQKRYLSAAIAKRNRYKNEHTSLYRSIIITVFALVGIVLFSLIGLLLIDSGIESSEWMYGIGGVTVALIIIMGIILTIILITLMGRSFQRIRRLLQT